MSLKREFLVLSVLILLFYGQQNTIAQCYELVWSEEFNYTGFPDPVNWNTEVGNNNGANNELQYYKLNDQDNCWVDSGRLVITALKESYGGQAYTSCRINTKGKAEFMYGKIEGRLRLPYGQGIWPAFWTLGGNISQVSWPACGEIDIMELIGGVDPRDRTSYGTPHWADANGNHAQYGGSKRLPSGKFADDFHIFSIEWTPQKITWYLDGVQFHVMTITASQFTEFHQKHFIILNLAVGGDWPGSPNATTVFPQKYEIDYVRVYQLAGNETIEGKDSVAGNEKQISYSLPAVEGRQFNWTVPDGVSILGRADSNAITVNWGCFPGDISCDISTSCGAQISFNKSVAVNQPVIEGPVFYDKTAGNLFFLGPESIETEYLWGIPDSATFISDSTGYSAEVAWGNDPGIVTLQISNSCGITELSKKIYKYGQLPYPDPESPFIIPGTLNSTDFDYGGEGVAYHDLDARNQGGGPRQEETVDTENQPGFTNVGWIGAGEWLEYTIKVPDPGYYKISLKVASANTTYRGPIRILINGEKRIEDIAVPLTGSWASFVDVSQRLLPLYANDTMLRIEALNREFNIGPITFTVDNTLFVSDFVNDTKKVKIYPNPVEDILNINLTILKPGNVDIKIRDISGKLLSSTRTKNLEKGNQNIEITNKINILNSGIYLIEISGPDHQFFSKFIKK